MTRTKAMVLMILAMGFLFYGMGAQVAPAAMTQELMRDLGLGSAGLGLMSAMFYWTYTAMQIPVGLLFDRFHPRRLILFALLLCALSAGLFASAQSVWLCGIARLILGVGAAFSFLSVLWVASHCFESRHFALIAGVSMILGAGGALGGEFPVAFAVHHIGWRNTQWMLAGLALFWALLILLFFSGMGKEGPKNKPTEQSTWQQLQAALSVKQVWWIGGYAFLNWSIMTGFSSLWAVPYLVAKFQMTERAAASLVAWNWIGVAVMSPLVGLLSDRIGRRCLLLSGLAVLGLASASILLYGPVTQSIAAVLLFFMGAACAGQSLSFGILKDNVNPHHQSTAMGFNNMAVVIGGAVFQPLIGRLLEVHNPHAKIVEGVVHYNAHDFRFALIVLPLCFFVSWIISVFFLKETYCRPVFSQ